MSKAEYDQELLDRGLIHTIFHDHVDAYSNCSSTSLPGVDWCHDDPDGLPGGRNDDPVCWPLPRHSGRMVSFLRVCEGHTRSRDPLLHNTIVMQPGGITLTPSSSCAAGGACP
ncbi:MAG: hypothetical protein M3461_02470 [Pseudomonadota bacterium]|nr:hypothetical protein [Pseudomonadota bacterium]